MIIRFSLAETPTPPEGRLTDAYMEVSTSIWPQRAEYLLHRGLNPSGFIFINSIIWPLAVFWFLGRLAQPWKRLSPPGRSWSFDTDISKIWNGTKHGPTVRVKLFRHPSSQISTGPPTEAGIKDVDQDMIKGHSLLKLQACCSGVFSMSGRPAGARTCGSSFSPG